MGGRGAAPPDLRIPELSELSAAIVRRQEVHEALVILPRHAEELEERSVVVRSLRTNRVGQAAACRAV